MLPHPTVRPSNLTDEELDAFLNNLKQADLYDYEYDSNE